MTARTRVWLAIAIVAVATASEPLAARRAARDVITEPAVRAHMTFLAGDALNGRGSGTRDEWITASYIGSQMARWGLEPLGDHGSFVQTVEMMRPDVTAPPVLSADSLTLTHGKQMIVQSLRAATVSGPLHKYVAGSPVPAGSVVLVPEGAGPEALQASAAAAVVLTIETPPTRERWDSLGARLPSLGRARLVSAPPPAAAAGPGAPGPLARIVIDKAAHAAMMALAPGVPVSLTAQVKQTQVFTWNAMGRLTGSDPKRAGDVILLTSHLDHLGARTTGADPIFNGADDDASGTTAVLSLVEALATGTRPKRTFVFACFGSEEAGGYGASAFVEHPPAPLTSIIANLEFEMIGRPDSKVPPRTLWLTGWERTTLGPELARHGARLVADPHPEQNFFQRSDNITLARRGVVAQTVSSYGLHKEYHQANDDLAHIDFAHMTEAIQSMLAPIRWLANASFTPAWRPGGQPK